MHFSLHSMAWHNHPTSRFVFVVWCILSLMLFIDKKGTHQPDGQETIRFLFKPPTFS